MNLTADKCVCERERQTAPPTRAAQMLFGGSGNRQRMGPTSATQVREALWDGHTCTEQS